MMALIAALDAYAAAFLAVLLLASAGHKAMDPRRLALAAARLAGLPAPVAPAVLAAATAGEVGAGLCLLFSATRAAGAVGATAIWGVYTLLIGGALAAGRTDMDCGCTFGGGHSRISRWEIGRNLALILLVGLTALGARTASSIGGLELLAALGLLTFYVALDQVGLSAPRAAWR